MNRLPRSLDDLAGRRAARWIRESTAGQVDRFGPDAQREHQDRAIERYELVDTGISWQVAHSGRTIAATGQWGEMLAGAGESWDILVVGYVSRFARDLRTAVNARHDLHAAGGAILFADERLLTSDEEAWESWAREAVEAEAYSRRLGKRIREGYAAKRRRLADPGGNPPFGFRRVGPDHVLEPDPATIVRALHVFERSAAGELDRNVAAAAGLPLPTVRGILRSGLYAGRLADGTPTRFAPPVPSELWDQAAEARDRRRRNRGGRAKGRPYALPMLACAACGRRLVGDGGRYRHLEVCPEFAAAATNGRRRRPGQHRLPIGASYPAGVYEAAIAAVLERVSIGSELIANVVTDLAASPEPDRLALARIERARHAASDRYVRDRDPQGLEAAMQRLDVEERALADRPALTIDRAAAVEYLRNLATLWADAPTSRRRLAEAIFERIEVLGLRRIRITPTRLAVEHGMAEAFAGGWSEPGRSRTNSNRLLVRLVPTIETRIELVLPPPAPLRLVRSA